MPEELFKRFVSLLNKYKHLDIKIVNKISKPEIISYFDLCPSKDKSIMFITNFYKTNANFSQHNISDEMYNKYKQDFLSSHYYSNEGHIFVSSKEIDFKEVIIKINKYKNIL